MTPLFYLMVLCLPFSIGGWSIEIAGVEFHPYIIMVVSLFPVALVMAGTGYAKLQVRLIDWLIAALALSFLATTLITETDRSGWRLAFRALFVPIASYLICRVSIRSEGVYRRAISAAGIGFVILAGGTLLTFIEQRVRPFVFSMPPIGVATLLMMGLVYLLYQRHVNSIVRLLGTTFFGVAFLVTLSRVYLLAVLVSPILNFACRRWLVLVWSVVLSTALIVTLAFTYGADLSQYSAAGTEGQDTVERMVAWRHIERAMLGRAFVYRESLQKLDDNLVFGGGIRVGDFQVTPHNFNVEWLEYGGVLGYLLFAAVFLANASSAAKFQNRDVELSVLNLILLIIILNSLTNGFMHGVMPFAAFILLGMTQARISLLTTAKDARQKPRRRREEYSRFAGRKRHAMSPEPRARTD